MQLSTRYVAGAFVLSLLVYPTAASEEWVRRATGPVDSNCTIGNYDRGLPLMVSSPEELRALIPANCSTLFGSINIASSYTGPFVLNGVKNFTGYISSADSLQGTVVSDDMGYVNSIDHVSLPGLTMFEMEDLIYMGTYHYAYPGIYLNSVPALTSVSVPDAIYISNIIFGNFSEASFDFSGLVNASSINISGNKISSILFPSLVGVDQDLGISSGSGVPRINVNLPSLANATSISISGNLSRVSMPELSLVTSGYAISEFGTGGLYVNNLDTSGLAVAMIFPQLHTANGVKFTGAIESVILPSLSKLQGALDINAFTPLDTSFPSLVEAQAIYLSGNITSVDFPALIWFGDMNIYSQLPLNCTPAYTALDRDIHHLNNITDPHPSVGGFSCYSSAKEESRSRSSLSMNAKLGIALGVGIGGLFALISLGFWHLYRKNKKQPKNLTAGGDEVELDDRTAGDLPPEYSSVVATEVGSLRSERTAVNRLGDQDDSHNDSAHARRGSEAANDGDVSPVTPVEGRNPFT